MNTMSFTNRVRSDNTGSVDASLGAVGSTREDETAGRRALVVEARNLSKIYRRGSDEIRAVDNVDFSIEPGEFVAIFGPSGAGKSTLLQMIGCMDTPTSGSLRIDGRETAKLSDRELTDLRRDHVGFVFQHFGLLPTMTVAENVAIPAMFSRRKVKDQVDVLIEKVGLSHRKNHRPAHLSGGEMQRTAIARALINSPRLLLADEPTGNLDTATSDVIIALLRTLNAEGLTVVVVTHNDALANVATRRIGFRDGKIV
jgi:ABC-type lipoprotein export system ATPase subunit